MTRELWGRGFLVALWLLVEAGLGCIHKTRTLQYK